MSLFSTITQKFAVELQQYDEGTLFVEGLTIKLGKRFPAERDEKGPYLNILDPDDVLTLDLGTEAYYYKGGLLHKVTASGVKHEGILTLLIREILPISRYF